MKAKLTIVLTGGGSGGHITPLLSLAHALRKLNKKCRIIYIGLKNEKLEDLHRRFSLFDEVYYVPAGKFRRYHGENFLAHLIDLKTVVLNIRDFFRVIRGVFSARRLLKRLRPDVVFSKGGFVAVPVGVAARRLKIPTVTHDSDAVAGLANRIVGRWAVVHATGLPAQHYSYPKSTVRFVGIPVDERIKPVTPEMQAGFKKAIGLASDQLVLLVGGAGLGSKDINDLTVAIAPKLLDRLPQLQIIHLTGEKHQDSVSQQYQQQLSPQLLARVKAMAFTSDFYKYTGAADLIVTRAGATTIAELALARKACLLIPAAHLTGGHQLKNAAELEKLGAVEVVPPDIRSEQLLERIYRLLRNQHQRDQLAAKLGAVAKPESADTLAKLLVEVASTKGQNSAR